MVLQRARCLSQKLLDKRRSQAIQMASTKKLLLDRDDSQHFWLFESLML